MRCTLHRMATSAALSVDEYLAELPADRRAVVSTLRDLIVANLPPGYSEGMLYGMIGYAIPLSRYPNTYNRQPLSVAGLAAQKGHLSLYLMSVYGDPALCAWFVEQHQKAGKKLDMGKSCIRFRTLEDLHLPAVAEVIRRVSVEDFIARYEAVRESTATAKRKSKSAP